MIVLGANLLIVDGLGIFFVLQINSFEILLSFLLVHQLLYIRWECFLICVVSLCVGLWDLCILWPLGYSWFYLWVVLVVLGSQIIPPLFCRNSILADCEWLTIIYTCTHLFFFITLHTLPCHTLPCHRCWQEVVKNYVVFRR